MVELKPCPFCGGYARMESGGPGCHYVRCDDCGACSNDGSQGRASGLWNTRTEHIEALSRTGAVTEAGVEAAARYITKWLGFSWDGLHDGRVTDKGFPIFTNGQFGWGFQGRRGDMLDLVRAALKAAMEAGG